MTQIAGDAPSGIDPAHFRHVLGHFPTGVTAVTASTARGPVGLAIGSFASVSLDPPLVAFFAGSGSGSWAGIQAAGAFCVNVLAADQEDVCRRFASRVEDKFTGLGWRAGPSGAPRLAGAVAWIDCTVEAITEAGDHDLCIGRVTDLAVNPAERHGPLLFLRGGYGRFST